MNLGPLRFTILRPAPSPRCEIFLASFSRCRRIPLVPVHCVGDTNGLVLYDSQLNPLGNIPPGFADTGVLFSVDGSKVYVLADANGTPQRLR